MTIVAILIIWDVAEPDTFPTSATCGVCEKVKGAMDEANAKVLEVWKEKGEEAAVAHMLSGRTYAEMRSMYG